MVYLAAVVSRHRFATKTVSEIVERLHEVGDDPAAHSLDSKEMDKLEILIFLEDGGYFIRDEKVHIITIRYFLSKAVDRIRNWKGNVVKRCLNGLRKVRYLYRGYGTIEMQILRTIGLEFGSYRLTFRRKVFEWFYAQALFNCFIDQLSDKSDARKNIKQWLLKCYIKIVPVKVGKTTCKPEKDCSTFNQLFEKEFHELSKEEFFVWCLGLPHYSEGVGERAVMIHMDAVRRFGLDIGEIRESISSARRRRP